MRISGLADNDLGWYGNFSGCKTVENHHSQGGMQRHSSPPESKRNEKICAEMINDNK
jgi:hypothetical protein